METIYGSHNSMTFLKAKNWFFEIFHIFWRCQNKTLEEQFKAGYRCFDIRVRLNSKTRKPEFAHGAAILKGNVRDYMVKLFHIAYSSNTQIYVRVVLEDTKLLDYNEEWFRDVFCFKLEDWTPYIIPFQGNRKGDWKQVYDFKCKPDLQQYVGSMMPDARWYEKIMPKCYAHRMNKKNKSSMQGDIAIFDFV